MMVRREMSNNDKEGEKPPSKTTNNDNDNMDTRREREAEIIAMGGDPSFLFYDDDEEEDESAKEEEETKIKENVDDTTVPSTSLKDGEASVPSVATVMDEKHNFPDGKGPQPKEVEKVNVAEWDGWAIEDAHFDE